MAVTLYRAPWSLAVVHFAVCLRPCGSWSRHAHAAPGPEQPRWTGLSDTVFARYAGPVGANGTALAQDASGFLWLSTQVGLLRWDGYGFRSYTADPQTPGSLPDSFIAALHVDSRGRLWIGTSAGGLARFDPALVLRSTKTLT